MPGTKVLPTAAMAPTTAHTKPTRAAHRASSAARATAAKMSLNDYQRLRSLLAARRGAAGGTAAIWHVENKLGNALMFNAEHLPPDVVSINSRVRIENTTTGGKFTYTLVFPGEANIIDGKLSVLSPLGCALLGQTVGDTVTYRAPGGEESVRILRLEFQPESVGQY